jgi:MoaA/NifB/PqqE/SkfB family radical SAM enzyme/DNA-binding XRE family transcriptional regulator
MPEHVMELKPLEDAQHDRSRVHRSGSASQNILPAVCDVSVTNICNAACDFCGFSRDKKLVGPRRYLDPEEFERALPILRRRRVRYVTFQGGEPLVHPGIANLVASATKAGMDCGLITNGWFMTQHMAALAAAGLKRLTVSIDSADMAEHERNRGLPGLAVRIEQGIASARAFSIPVDASVTVSRLVRYEALPATLTKLGFSGVNFSYPRREPFGSTSLVFDESSTLIDMGSDELLNALTEIARLKKKYPVLAPKASLAEVARFVRGESQLVPCVGGHKYFYLDWNLDIWRCEAWQKPLGSVFDLDRIPDQREPCNACMMACYRHASALMHGAIAVTDAAQDFRRGHIRKAFGSLFQRGVAFSLRALLAEELPRLMLPSVRQWMAPFRSKRTSFIGPNEAPFESVTHDMFRAAGRQTGPMADSTGTVQPNSIRGAGDGTSMRCDGAKIAKIRETLGLSQQEVASRANLSHSAVARIERGLLVFTPSVQEVASVLGLSLRDMQRRDDVR